MIISFFTYDKMERFKVIRASLTGDEQTLAIRHKALVGETWRETRVIRPYSSTVLLRNPIFKYKINYENIRYLDSRVKAEKSTQSDFSKTQSPMIFVTFA